MDGINRLAFETAKEITISCLNGVTSTPNKKVGEDVADFFDAVYNRVLKIAKDAEVK